MEPTLDGRDDAPVVVTTSGSRLEAMVAVTALTDAGYGAVLLSDDAGGLHPEMSYLYGGAYRIAVPAADAEGARTFLDELDAGEHAFPDEPGSEGDAGEDERGGGVGLDGRRRGWAVIAVAVVLVFVVFRLVDSATSFGLF